MDWLITVWFGLNEFALVSLLWWEPNIAILQKWRTLVLIRFSLNSYCVSVWLCLSSFWSKYLSLVLIRLAYLADWHGRFCWGNLFSSFGLEAPKWGRKAYFCKNVNQTETMTFCKVCKPLPNFPTHLRTIFLTSPARRTKFWWQNLCGL